MKRMTWIFLGTLLLLGVSAASAQSLGDYARTARKNKPQANGASKHYDNDNLPTTEQLSVVGPAPAAGGNGQSSATTMQIQADAKAEHQKANDDLQKQIDKQKEKIDALSRELDLEQREYRLRAAAMYGDAGNRLRNAAQWDKDDTQYKSDTASKQKSIEAARQQLEDLQEQARKAGMKQKEEDDQGKDKDKE